MDKLDWFSRAKITAGLGQAAPVSSTVQLSGAQQVPPVQTSATGKESYL
jgi:hypothetical protein